VTEEKTTTTPQFTPGPWDFMEGRTLLHVETANDHPAGAGIAICSLAKNQHANAHLIAAAPELYALALQVAEHFENTDAPLGAAARAALAKAEGR